MKLKRKKSPLTALTCASLLGSAALSQAALTIGDIISVNFNSVASTNTPTGAAVIGQSGDIWTEIFKASWDQSVNGTYALNKTTGASSGVSLAFAGDAGSHGNGPVTNLDVFESGFFLDANGGGYNESATITLSGLGAGTIIDLYLYAAAGHTAGEGATFNFGSSQTTTDANTTETAYQLGVNYVKYAGLVADGSGNISGTWTKATASNYSVFSGAQIAVIPEPSAAILGGLGMLALLRRRR